MEENKIKVETIAPVPVEVLKAELTPDKLLRKTNKANNEIYVITWHDSPNVMREIGRLRKIAFNSAGGNINDIIDLDRFDTSENCYKQILVWNPDAEEIIGGYRYFLGKDWEIRPDGQPDLATSHMFHFSERFMKDYAPWTVELGRSFVTVEYQSTLRGSKSIFALDNLWDGLGAIVVKEPTVRYLFGKFTMYPSYDRMARDMILYFISKHFPDPDKLVNAIKPLQLWHDPEIFRKLFTEDDFKADYRILNREVRALGFNIPPLVNAYMGLSPTMKAFGTAINEELGDLEETGILIAVDEIFQEKRMRHIDTFAAEHPELVQATSGDNRIFYKPTASPVPSKGGGNGEQVTLPLEGTREAL